MSQDAEITIFCIKQVENTPLLFQKIASCVNVRSICILII